ncbi:glycosyltransferase [Amycolatopsis sp. NPDC021455]|uniref:glycosyltransferase n=1 Tax=Amycolatopsis sp. NPDC021455 TaxID=3154901 RepID=UPI0033FB4CB3
MALPDSAASLLVPAPVGKLAIERFEPLIGEQAYRRLQDRFARARELLGDHVMWHVNSTARGGGVAEMLHSLLAYGRGAGLDERWLAIAGTAPFFAVTKRLHNNLHGAPGDGLPLDAEAREVYESFTRAAGEELAARLSPGDVVLLHDPQSAGMVPALAGLGVPVVWRSHVGIDHATPVARRAWEFLRGYVRQADAYVFSRRQHVWDDLAPAKTALIAPSIDAFSAKNQDLPDDRVTAILAAAGVQDTPSAGDPVFTRLDGSAGRVGRRARMTETRRLRPDDAVVLQVSRWDRLKDPLGVIDGFVRYVLPSTDAHLVLAGPSVEEVADDPEGGDVLDEAMACFATLPSRVQEHVHLATLPMADLEENAAIVNALQRRAQVVVQKSIAEGFGLTVAEAMWKARAVVAGRIGGIQDQIENGRTGCLVDALDPAAFGSAVTDLLTDPVRAAELGEQARLQVRREFLGTRSFLQYIALYERLVTGRGVPAEVSFPPGYA